MSWNHDTQNNIEILQKRYIENIFWINKHNKVIPLDTYIKQELFKYSFKNYHEDKILKLIMINIKRKFKGKSYFSLYHLDTTYPLTAHESLSFIEVFCYKNKINLIYFLQMYIFYTLSYEKVKQATFKDKAIKEKLLKITSLTKLSKEELEKRLDDFDDFTIDYYKTMKNNILKALTPIFNLLVTPKLFNGDFLDHINDITPLEKNRIKQDLQKTLKYTYYFSINKVKKDYKNQNIPYKFDIHLKLDDEVINDELKILKNIQKSFTDKKTLANKKRYKEHYLNIFDNDEIALDIQGDSITPYFKGFTEALTIGLYAKGLYIGSYKDKRVLINELKKAKEELLKFQDNNKENIKLIDSLIEFFSQDKRIAEHIPYKTISKKLDIPKNQIRSLLRKIFLKAESKADNYPHIEEKIKTLDL